MSKIQRWEVDENGDCYHDVPGQWVKYEDHMTAVNAATSDGYQAGWNAVAPAELTAGLHAAEAAIFTRIYTTVCEDASDRDEAVDRAKEAVEVFKKVRS